MRTDIVRRVAQEMLNTSMQDITAEVVNGWATRLGDALTCEKSSQVGNAAKMREALVKILWCLEWMFNNTDNKSLQSHLCEPIVLAKSTLFAPPRNCDRFKTKEEAALAYAREANAFIPQSILWQIGEWLDWIFAEAKGETK